jgi:pyruvate dehydrogenase E2 component (dihydrolipoamide acetyltransferase)
MTRLMQIGASSLHRSWLNIPHVTQFDQADITELEAFRVAQKAVAEKAGVKLTVLPLLLKACAHLLKELPDFNSSLAPSGKAIIRKKYVHIGFAVDTPDGLLVPVIKNVDQKSLLQLAAEAAALAAKARDKKLTADDMQGACFTISSLGHIGGTGFTPIVNAPEVAILGVSKATIQPVWDGKAFQPKLMLPLSLSYDHRVINGAAAARFTQRLSQLLATSAPSCCKPDPGLLHRRPGPRTVFRAPRSYLNPAHLAGLFLPEKHLQKHNSPRPLCATSCTPHCG